MRRQVESKEEDKGMQEHSEWAKAENAEVEQGKQDFADAQKAEALRQAIAAHAANAVKYGNVDRDWVNAHLVRLGATPVSGQAQYQINVPIDGSYGTTVTAGSRAEALEKFNTYVQHVLAAGEIRVRHCGEGVYGVTLTGGKPVFYSGPEDPEGYDGPVPGLEGVKKGIREMLKEGVSGQNWGYGYAQEQLAAMGLEPLSPPVTRSVQVPVSGHVQMNVQVFEDDDDEAVQAAVAGVMARSKNVYIQPDEIGQAFTPRPDTSETMGLTVVDDDGDVF